MSSTTKNQEQYQWQSTQAKVIGLVNQKGGVGKTTITFNLAYAFQRLGLRVLCLDLDPQGNLTYLFNRQQEEEDFHLYHLLINSIRELRSLHQPVCVADCIKLKNEVDYIGTGSELSAFDLSVASIKSPRQLILRRFLNRSGLKDMYDLILIDGPPTLGLIFVNILCASDGILIPFRPDQFSKNSLFQLSDTIESVEEMEIVPPPNVIGCIPNLFEGRRRDGRQDLASIKEEIQHLYPDSNVFEPIANKVWLDRCLATGKSIFSYDSKEYLPLQEQFLKMARECTSHFSLKQ